MNFRREKQVVLIFVHYIQIVLDFVSFKILYYSTVYRIYILYFTKYTTNVLSTYELISTILNSLLF